MTQITPPILQYEPAPRRHRVRRDVAYILPMAVFLAFTQVGVTWPSLYPATYVAKTFIAAVLLIVLWRRYTPIRWDHWWLGAILGAIGVAQWIGMDKLLMGLSPAGYPRLTATPFNPYEHFGAEWHRMSFIAVRWAGASLVVPVMEELFWRDFAWRSVIAPNDFELAEVGEWDWKALLVITLIFSVVHIQWPSAIVWGLMIALLLTRTRSLGACIVMHGVTNFLLGLYVLKTGEWGYW